VPLDQQYIENTLHQWVLIIRKSRQLSDTGRFIELRYEDLVETPAEMMKSLLTQLGLRWQERCLRAFDDRAMASRPGSYPRVGAIKLSSRSMESWVPGLSELCEELGYTDEIELDIEAPLPHAEVTASPLE
jgi:Sulfotransferase family